MSLNCTVTAIRHLPTVLSALTYACRAHPLIPSLPPSKQSPLYSSLAACPGRQCLARECDETQTCGNAEMSHPARRYKVGKTLGQGTYAVVKEAVHIKTGQYYACKVISKRLMEGREHMVRNEIAALKKVSQVSRCGGARWQGRS